MTYLSLTIDSVRPAGIFDPFGLASFFASMAASQQNSQKDSDCTFADIKDIRQTIEGDEDAFKRIVERYQQKISLMMWRFSRDLLIHEELVQDVFVQAYMSIRSFKQKSPFSHWLCRIATNVGYQYWKERAKQTSRKTVSLQDWDKDIATAAANSDSAKSAEILENLLDQLSPRDRLIITLRYIEEYSIEETTDLTGWSNSMVKVQSWRAKKRLKKLVNQNS